MARRLAIALVHHPVLDGQGKTVTTALTNLDVHDLARSARTYGCSDFFVVHPIEAQRELASRIVDHWTTGSSAKRIPDRKEALSVVRPVATLDDAIAGLGGAVDLWITAARELGAPISFARARERLAAEGGPVLLVFGTGWGLAGEVVSRADAVLEPIRGAGDWNHLSVRAACAIALDRLRG
ncbi:MAG: RNA methyltransferase [Labilithrix sp.]|nr:RNA methyltransferase [Labilithrix sp.]